MGSQPLNIAVRNADKRLQGERLRIDGVSPKVGIRPDGRSCSSNDHVFSAHMREADMVFDNNFEPVPVGDGGTLVDAVTKLRLSHGRWTPESAAQGGTIEIDLSHDPAIEPGRLTMPPSARDLKYQAMLNGPPLAEVIFRSAQSQQIAKLIIDIENWGEEVALVAEGGRDPTLEVKADLIRMAQCEVVSEHPWATLRYMFESIPLMPLWQSKYAAAWGARRVGIYVPRAVALELFEHTGLAMLGGDDALVRIASRGIGA